MLNIRKILGVMALAACVSACLASGESGRTNSLFFTPDDLKPMTPQAQPLPLLQIDDKTDETKIEYTWVSQAGWDPEDISLTSKNCGTLLGITAVLGLIYLLRDRLFPYYR